MAGWLEGDLQENSGEGATRMMAQEKTLSWVDLLKRTYGLYRTRFEEYFPLMLGASLVTYAAWYGLEYLRALLVVNPAHRSVFDESFPSLYFRGKLIGWLLWCLEVLVSWIAMTFAFGCVAVKVLAGANEALRQQIPASRAFREAASRFPRIGSIAMWGALSTIFFYSFLLPLLLRPLPWLWWFALRFNYEMYLLTYSTVRGLILLTFGILLSRMALALPSLIDNPDRPLREAVSVSLRYTTGHQTFLSLWLGACAVCGGLAYFMLADVLQIACTHRDIPPAACSLFLVLLAVAVSALLAGPAFILFSLLYFESSLRAASLPVAAR